MLTQPALRATALYNGKPSEAFEQDRNMIIKYNSGYRIKEWKVTYREILLAY